jgi:hypothetical protein
MNRYLLKFREGRDTGGTFTQEIEALNAADAIAQGKLLHERTSPRPTLVKCEPVKPYEITYHIGEIQGEMQIDNLQVSADKQPHCCPVCYGRGFVAQGFYSGTGETFMSAGGTEPCRSCKGSGIVWNNSPANLPVIMCEICKQPKPATEYTGEHCICSSCENLK